MYASTDGLTAIPIMPCAVCWESSSPTQGLLPSPQLFLLIRLNIPTPAKSYFYSRPDGSSGQFPAFHVEGGHFLALSMMIRKYQTGDTTASDKSGDGGGG